METSQIIQALLAFIFVLGLMFITLWLIKFCQQKGLNCRLHKCLKKASRLRIIEQRRLDVRNQVVLIECDSEEYLLLLGAANNLILNQTKPKAKRHD